MTKLVAAVTWSQESHIYLSSKIWLIKKKYKWIYMSCSCTSLLILLFIILKALKLFEVLLFLFIKKIIFYYLINILNQRILGHTMRNFTSAGGVYLSSHATSVYWASLYRQAFGEWEIILVLFWMSQDLFQKLKWTICLLPPAQVRIKVTWGFAEEYHLIFVLSREKFNIKRTIPLLSLIILWVAFFTHLTTIFFKYVNDFICIRKLVQLHVNVL